MKEWLFLLLAALWFLPNFCIAQAAPPCSEQGMASVPPDKLIALYNAARLADTPASPKVHRLAVASVIRIADSYGSGLKALRRYIEPDNDGNMVFVGYVIGTDKPLPCIVITSGYKPIEF